jgi:hypothetical protein
MQPCRPMRNVVSTSRVRELEKRVRDLERLLGRKTMENEILKEAIVVARLKNRSCRRCPGAIGRTVRDEDRGQYAGCRPIQSDRTARQGDPSSRPLSESRGCRPPTPIRAIIDERPTYGYRRVWALLNRHLRSAGKPTVNMKRVLRLMQNHGLTLERHTARRPDRTHDGVIIALHSNIRWCSDHLELHARNREVVRILFVLDACDREIIAWSAVANAGISGEMVRDLMVAAVERRSNAHARHIQSTGCPTTEVPTSPRTLPTSPALSA